MPNLYIKRQIEPLLQEWLKKPEVIFLTGARQVGKTTLLQKISSNQEKKQIITFINLEEPVFRRKAQEDPYRFLQELRTKTKGKHFIFLDEFQKVPPLLSAIKLFYDQDKDRQMKFVLSGSASIITRKTGEESLLGRSIRLNLFSFSFLEFNRAKNFSLAKNDSLGQILLGLKDADDYNSQWTFPSSPFFEEYLLWGGFPRIVFEEKETNKLTLSENIKQAFLEKDIQALIKEEQLTVFEQLMEILAARCGQLISFSSLARDLTVAPQTVRHLAFLLKHSFWLDFVYPQAFFGSGYKKSPKIYFHDLGVRHGLLRWLALPKDPVQMGAIAENLVFNILTKLLAYEPSFAGKITFWQTYDGAEVDFVLSLGQRLIGIEVKYQSFSRPLLSPGSRSFIKKFKPDLFLVVSKEGTFKEKREKTAVLFIPLIDFATIV